MSTERALIAARRGYRALQLGQTRDAAWLGLLALEEDDACGLAWSLLARIVLEATGDSLGTVVTRWALDLPLPEPERDDVEQFSRIDLWSRGLLAHEKGAALLSGPDLEGAHRFSPTPRLEPWTEEQRTAWGGDDAAARALARMVAALSDAWSPPPGADDPLKASEGWQPTPEFAAWQAGDPLAAEPLPSPPANDENELNVLSDYWIAQEISELGAQGRFDLALERADLWARLRPNRVMPKLALVRLYDATGETGARDREAEAVTEAERADLNDLEEARLVLGELGLWRAQIAVLERMQRMAPGHPVILANLGAARMQVGEDEAGARDLEAALEADPDNGPALANLALFRMREDEYVAARELLERAVKVAPEEADVRVYLAVCKNNQGLREAAVEELHRALRIDPEHESARELLADLTGP